ncbi:MAG: hypothetical protein V4640_03915 [Verrucomicrobiota bacterium]
MKTPALLVLAWSIAASATQAAVTISFDEFGSQPGLFASTVALTNEYAGVGVIFSGNAPGNGGGILDQSGNFGVNALSGSNFLAFNPAAIFSGGGVPNSPQTISFLSGASSVSLWAGAQFGGGFTLTAYDALNNIVDVANVANTGGAYAQLSVSGNIAKVTMASATNRTWVVDDLSFEAGRVSVPDGGSTLALLSVVFGGGLLARGLRRK